MLGVDSSITSNFSFCSNEVGRLFYSNLDEFRPTYHYVAALLERGVRALIYVGKHDWICNHVGNERWTLDLEWTKHQAFSTQPLREWIVDGKVAGMTRSAGGLTFATFDGAGHMACPSFYLLMLPLMKVPISRYLMINRRNRWSLLTDG